MKQFNILFGILLGVVLINGVVTEIPTQAKVYAIQSAMDGGLGMNLGSGKICQNLASIVPIYGMNPPYPERFLWTVSSVSNLTGGVTIYNKVQEEGYILNSLSFDEYPPYCYPVYRDLLLTSTDDGGYITIKNRRDNMCLTSQGSEVGMFFWMPCGNGGQNLNFIEIEE